MKRLAITLEQVAGRANLLRAVAKAVRGKRQQPAVRQWLHRLEPELARLAQGILAAAVPGGAPRQFVIHDPKTRTITAAPLAARVLHHAVLNLAEARFEQMLVPSSFACRPGKGVHAAVAQVQRHLRRPGWWLQMDVQAYFASICHRRLLALLARRFKGAEFLALLERIVHAGAAGAGVGLPIGALTSQHFANAYLDAADRWLLAQPEVHAHVRYMDDIVVWCGCRADAWAVYQRFAPWLLAQWGLRLKPPRVGANERGLAFCGFRVRRGAVLPSRRKLARYRAGARRWVQALAGVPSAQAQRGHEVLHATLAHTRSQRFRRRVWASLGAWCG